TWLFFIWRHDSVDNSGLPFSHRVLRFDEAQPVQVKQDAFVFAADHLVAPAMRFHFMADLASENGYRVAMITVSGKHFCNGVTARQQDREEQRNCAPSINMGAPFLIKRNTYDLRRQQQ